MSSINLEQGKRIHIALPVLDESAQLPAFLDMLEAQTFCDFTLHVCVNQPDEWWDMPERARACHDNQNSIAMLNDWDRFPVRVIDRSAKGKGWLGRKHGVGWARKTVMDSIHDIASPFDITVSLDADTLAGPEYLQSVMENLEQHPGAMGIAVPYYHRLTGEPEADRAILRYEIYMRNYNIHMLRIKSPYAFTALGSAIAFPDWAYRKIGGMTPMLSGEDFYFLQKMVKTGPVLRWNPEKVYPAARFSNRVYFGTGPAMEKGRKGDWDSYPIYHHTLFSKIKDTNDRFSDLYISDIQTPIDDFINEKFNKENIWHSLRRNYKSREKFIEACHSRLDGLRILQYLKNEQKKMSVADENCLIDNLEDINIEYLKNSDIEWGNLSFASTPVNHLDRIRNVLVEIEDRLQKGFCDVLHQL